MGGDSTMQTTENTINPEHLVSYKNLKHPNMNETMNSEINQSFMVENSGFKQGKLKESSMLKLNESSILSINPHFKNMHHSSDIRAEESMLNQILPDHFLASMKDEDIQNFNTLTEKEKKYQIMMMRRKSSKSLAMSKYTKSPQSIESKKMIQNQVVYQPNILNIPNNSYKNIASPNRLNHMSINSHYNHNSNMKNSKVLTGLSSAKRSDHGYNVN